MLGKKVKEGIYSPVTQNQRHLNVIKECRKESKGNIIFKTAFEHSFDEKYISLIVLANPKTYFNCKYAPKELKDKVIRADKLIETIKKINDSSKDTVNSEKEMREVAQFYLAANKSERSDFTKKYEEILEQIEQEQKLKNEETELKQDNNVAVANEEKGIVDSSDVSNDKICPKCGSKLVLRKATKGNNEGKSFYGCSSFPKCRYIENVENK